MEEIRQTIAAAEKHQSDPGPFSALHTAEAVIVNIAGRRVLGRDAIHEAVSRALETPLADVLTRIEIEDIRFVTPDVALVSCTKHVFDGRVDPSKPVPSKGSMSYVLVREPDAWRIALAHTTPISV